MGELKVIGISHNKASIGIREKFSLNKAERENFYLQLRDIFGINEALILSTCNRTEVYYVRHNDLNDQVIGLLSSYRGCEVAEIAKHFVSISDNEKSLKHLYEVAIGLDSLVLGDIQIFGQVKQAYQESSDLGFAQSFLHRAMHTMFHTHKQVCEQTSFKDGAASVSYNAVKLLKDKSFTDIDASILVVGAGKMGADVCSYLSKLGFTKVTVCNRTISKSQDLHESLNIAVLPFENLFEDLANYQVIISAVESPTPLFDISKTSTLDKKLYAVDLCSPRSFSSEFIEENLFGYYDIDYIGGLTEQTINNRKNEISKVEDIIDNSLEEFQEWVEFHDQTRQIKKFKETLEQLRKEAMSEYLKKLDQPQVDLIEQVSKSIIQKIVKLPALQLKQTCEREHADKLGQSLNDLFNLELKAKHKLNTQL